MREPLTRSSDPSRSMPAGAGGRVDEARAALASLDHERRRLERLGLEIPLARCHEQIRYWRFVAALVALPGLEAAGGSR